MYGLLQQTNKQVDSFQKFKKILCAIYDQYHSLLELTICKKLELYWSTRLMNPKDTQTVHIKQKQKGLYVYL